MENKANSQITKKGFSERNILYSLIFFTLLPLITTIYGLANGGLETMTQQIAFAVLNGAVTTLAAANTVHFINQRF